MYRNMVGCGKKTYQFCDMRDGGSFAKSMDQPALDEKSFTASLQIASATGQGGPFIAAATNSTPVVSTLVNGEPIVVMRIGPVMNPVTSAPSDHFSAMPLEPISAAPAPTFVSQADEATSPQAIITSIPKAPRIVPAPLSAPAEIAEVAPAKPVSRARSKPSTTEIVAAAPKPAKLKDPAPPVVLSTKVEDDVYQPPAPDAFVSSAPDLTAPPPAPALETQPAAVEPAPAATSGPAPLIPMAQP